VGRAGVIAPARPTGSSARLPAAMARRERGAAAGWKRKETPKRAFGCLLARRFFCFAHRYRRGGRPFFLAFASFSSLAAIASAAGPCFDCPFAAISLRRMSDALRRAWRPGPRSAAPAPRRRGWCRSDTSPARWRRAAQSTGARRRRLLRGGTRRADPHRVRIGLIELPGYVACREGGQGPAGSEDAGRGARALGVRSTGGFCGGERPICGGRADVREREPDARPTVRRTDAPPSPIPWNAGVAYYEGKNMR